MGFAVPFEREFEARGGAQRDTGTGQQAGDGARVPIEGGLQVVRQYRGRDGGILVGMRFIHLDGANSGRLAAWLAEGAGH